MKSEETIFTEGSNPNIVMSCDITQNNRKLHTLAIKSIQSNHSHNQRNSCVQTHIHVSESTYRVNRIQSILDCKIIERVT
ncbi:hypothetical protein GQ44DRAFT_150528 [Phaeosphaeriaceae sp. PMI808]|nr:hypothetical protein GQ44DRAFT_150528 [Phaeosphaeriaceae sp. PMI808]